MGMDYALTAMFICLLVFQIRGFVFVVTALVAAASAVLLYLYLPGNAYIIIASCLAATFGFWIKRIMLRREALR
jgi:predicted branched-subunit amino acid permease